MPLVALLALAAPITLRQSRLLHLGVVDDGDRVELVLEDVVKTDSCDEFAENEVTSFFLGFELPKDPVFGFWGVVKTDSWAELEEEEVISFVTGVPRSAPKGVVPWLVTVVLEIFFEPPLE